ncbi:hypothetical protein F0L68_25680 [Solihabitans fulvus]|uniref:Uncharacterized protein n=1 Tax=Solihabitans fulvus TaxID=1892852 RepID=A0A5B2WZC1_9PSEU|nr:hypothetical protein [Solihabitans fulvus]KAA2256895.1 hypothetical protein F0L68_25680 [Solihabitans fulvus]
MCATSATAATPVRSYQVTLSPASNQSGFVQNGVAIYACPNESACAVNGYANTSQTATVYCYTIGQGQGDQPPMNNIVVNQTGVSGWVADWWLTSSTDVPC